MAAHSRTEVRTSVGALFVVGIFASSNAWGQDATVHDPAAGTPNGGSSSAGAADAGAATSGAASGSSTIPPSAEQAPHDPKAPAAAPRATDPVNPPSPREASASPPSTGRFEFGSYGRVNVASDARGGTGRPADVVAFGSRLDEESYAELELRREDRLPGGIDTRIVTTLALLPPFFHFSGKLDTTIAVRQLYAQGTIEGWTLWGGARMYRGDDVYLFNFWPLDNQNTVGGGVGKALASDTHIALHAGMQRLDQPYQYQEIPAPRPFGIGAQNITYLDRPRTIETLKVTQFFRNKGDKKYFHGEGMENAGFKVVGYGELHQISAGARRDTASQQDVSLPSDSGWMLGTQLTYFTGKRDTYLSLVMRHARALAAYDPLATPDQFTLERDTSGASETRLVLSGNYEVGDFGLTGASYLRWFRDAGPASTTLAKYDEGAIALRPQWYFAEHFGLAVEGSYQARRYAFLAADGSGPLSASLVRGAIMPYFSPTGRGSFKRPIIGLLYLATSRDSGARSLYPEGDTFRSRSLEHYVGLTVEWWFNSSSYP